MSLKDTIVAFLARLRTRKRATAVVTPGLPPMVAGHLYDNPGVMGLRANGGLVAELLEVDENGQVLAWGDVPNGYALRERVPTPAQWRELPAERGFQSGWRTAAPPVAPVARPAPTPIFAPPVIRPPAAEAQLEPMATIDAPATLGGLGGLANAGANYANKPAAHVDDGEPLEAPFVKPRPPLVQAPNPPVKVASPPLAQAGSQLAQVASAIQGQPPTHAASAQVASPPLSQAGSQLAQVTSAIQGTPLRALPPRTIQASRTGLKREEL